MAKNNKEAIAIVLDIGPCPSGVQSYEDFLQKAKHCISNIILRKMFAESHDVISIIVVGSKRTENELAENGGYLHVQVLAPFLKASWELLEAVSCIRQTDVEGDWLDAVVVGIHNLRNKLEDTEDMKVGFSVAKLVLFSTFTSHASDDQVDSIVDGMKDNGIEFVTIVPDCIFDQSEENALTVGQKLIIKIMDEVDSKPFSIDQALTNLSVLRTKKGQRAKWNATLNIGKDICVDICGYKLIAKKDIKTALKHSTEDIVLTSDQGFVKGVYAFERSDIVDGYLYGNTVIPVSDVEKQSFEYKPGKKGIDVIGFFKQDALPPHLWVGDSGYYIIGRSNSENIFVTSLVKSLHEMKMVALVRKVYSNNYGLRIGVLYPKIDAVPMALIFVDLPFADDVKSLWFPSIKTEDVTEEQLNSIDELIDSMDLTAINQNEEVDEEEPYIPETLIDPRDQYLLHCIAKKGLNFKSDDDSNVFEVPEFVTNSLKPIEQIQENSKTSLENIKNLFPLEDVQKKAKELENQMDVEVKVEIKEEIGTNQKNEFGDITDFFQSDISSIGTVTPEEDFAVLLKKGEIVLEEILEQMQNAIMELLTRVNSVEMLQKPSSALGCLRKTCIKATKSQIYNAWLFKLKELIVKRDQRDFWDIVVKDNLGLITEEEMPFSYTTCEDAKEFIKYEIPEHFNDGYMELDDNDLLDDI